jgi:CDP-diacylglycerol---serine O-phosphatidyltransferase
MPEETNNSRFRKGLYLIPSTFTAGNIAMGFLAVLASLRGFQILATDLEKATVYFDYAAIYIGFAIIFDTLDGRVARLTNTTTEIGVQLDSFADVLTFGIAPTVLIYSWAIGPNFGEQSSIHALGVFVLFMYLMCGAFRLARFNLQSLRPRVLLEGTQKVDKKNFVGLPIPPAAGLIAAIVHFSPTPLNSYGQYAGGIYTVLMIMLLAFLGLLMVSTVRYSSFKSAGAGKRSIYFILLIAAICMAMWLYSRYVLLGISLIYVSHGLIWYLWGMLKKPQKSAVESPST